MALSLIHISKAHTRHIYEKLGINTRQELLDLLMTEQ